MPTKLSELSPTDVTALRTRLGIAASGSVQVSVANYGAVGNVKVVADGAMTAGSTTLTSATAGFVAADVGKGVIVQAAGPLDPQPVRSSLTTTIAAVTNGTTVTLAAAAAATTSAARVVWGTDDTAAFQSAIDAVAAIDGGGIVDVPAKPYLITFGTPTRRFGLEMKSNVWLRGIGLPTLYFPPVQDGGYPLHAAIVIGRSRPSTKVANATVSGLVLEGGAYTQTGQEYGPAFVTINCTNIRITDNFIYRFTGDAFSTGQEAGDIRGLWIQRNYVTEICGNGLSYYSPIGERLVNDLYVTDNYFTQPLVGPTGGAETILFTGVGRFLIDNNICYKYGAIGMSGSIGGVVTNNIVTPLNFQAHGIGIGASDTALYGTDDDVVVEGNVIDMSLTSSLFGSGIQFLSGRRVAIRGNIIRRRAGADSPPGINLNAGTKDGLTVEGNIIYGATSPVASFADIHAAVTVLNDCAISGNVLMSNTVGMYLDQANACIISGNRSKFGGIAVIRGARHLITNNLMDATVNTPVIGGLPAGLDMLECTDAIVSGNHAKGAYYGVRLRAGGGNFVTGNIINAGTIALAEEAPTAVSKITNNMRKGAGAAAGRLDDV